MDNSIHLLYDVNNRSSLNISFIGSSNALINICKHDSEQCIGWFIDRAIMYDLVFNIRNLIDYDIDVNYGNVQQNTQYQFNITETSENLYIVILSEISSHTITLSETVTKSNLTSMLQYIESHMNDDEN